MSERRKNAHATDHVVDLIVPGDVLVQCAYQNHGDHAREKQHDHERIEDRKPLNASLWQGLENVIPSARPTNGVVLRELHAVGEWNVDQRRRRLECHRLRRPFAAVRFETRQKNSVARADAMPVPSPHRRTC